MTRSSKINTDPCSTLGLPGELYAPDQSQAGTSSSALAREGCQEGRGSGRRMPCGYATEGAVTVPLFLPACLPTSL